MKKLTRLLAVIIVTSLVMGSCAGSGHMSHRPYKHGHKYRYHGDRRFQYYNPHKTW